MRQPGKQTFFFNPCKSQRSTHHTSSGADHRIEDLRYDLSPVAIWPVRSAGRLAAQLLISALRYADEPLIAGNHTRSLFDSMSKLLPGLRNARSAAARCRAESSVAPIVGLCVKYCSTCGLQSPAWNLLSGAWFLRNRTLTKTEVYSHGSRWLCFVML